MLFTGHNFIPVHQPIKNRGEASRRAAAGPSCAGEERAASGDGKTPFDFPTAKAFA